MKTTTKTCRKCHEAKPLERFGVDSRGGSGRKSRCKDCTNAARREPKTEKRCTNCGVTKPLDDFNKSSKGRCGRRSQCKACGALATKARRYKPLPGGMNAPIYTPSRHRLPPLSLQDVLDGRDEVEGVRRRTLKRLEVRASLGGQER